MKKYSRIDTDKNYLGNLIANVVITCVFVALLTCCGLTLYQLNTQVDGLRHGSTTAKVGK